jgi:hypothetical protein
MPEESLESLTKSVNSLIQANEKLLGATSKTREAAHALLLIAQQQQDRIEALETQVAALTKGRK